MRNILEICQDVADLTAVKKPINLTNDTSQHDAIFRSIASDALQSIMRYGDWQELTKDAELRTAGNKTVYPISFIAEDFYALINNTIYIKDGQNKVIGSITPEQWQREKHLGCASVDVKFKIQNSCIRFLSPPPNGLKIIFQYRSRNIVIDVDDGYQEKTKITANTNIPLFDDYLVEKAIHWRWLSRNGMDYAEEFNEYQQELKKRFGSGLATQDINLTSGVDIVNMGVVINAAIPNKPW